VNATPVNAAAELEPRTDTGNGPLVLLIHPAGADSQRASVWLPADPDC
jgi:hypothetical protein